MNTKTQNEYARLAKNANNQIVSSFGADAAPRTAVREQLKDGDIITFPTDLTDRIIESKIRNSDATASYILVDVERGGKQLSVPFYPSYLWKARMEYDPATKMPTGVMHSTSGDVSDFVNDFTTLDEGIMAIGKKGKVIATLKAENTFKTMPYGGIDGKDALQNCTIFDYNWK